MADTDPARIGDVKAGLAAAKADTSTRATTTELSAAVEPLATRDGSNVEADAFRGAIGAVSSDELASADGAQQVGFVQYPSLSVRAASEKLREWVSPEDAGAVGDGVSDDGPALQMALQYASDTGVPFRAKSGAKYRVGSAISVDRRGTAKPLSMDFQKSEVHMDGVGATLAGWRDPYLTTGFLAYPKWGDTKLNLVSAAGMLPGDIILIESPAFVNHTVRCEHYYVVREVSGNTVWIEGTVPCDINPQQVVDSGASGPIVVTARRQSPPLHLSNLSMTITDPKGAVTGLLIDGGSLVQVDGVITSGAARMHIYVMRSGYNTVVNSHFSKMGYLDQDDLYVNKPTQPDGLGYGYGLIHSRNARSAVQNCHGHFGWHTFDAARGEMDITYQGCSAKHNAYAYSLHEGAWRVRYTDCAVDGGLGFTVGRGIDVSIRGAKGTNLRSHGVSYGEGMVSLVVEDSSFSVASEARVTFRPLYRDPTPPVSKAGSTSSGRPTMFKASRNEAVGPFAQFDAGGTTYDFVSVVGNTSDSMFEVQGKHAIVEQNFCRRTSQHAFHLAGPFANGGAARGNTCHAAHDVGNSAMFLVRNLSSSFDFQDNCNKTAEYLIRGAPITVGVVKGNVTSKAGSRLYLGDAASTVLASIGNVYRHATSEFGGVVVTTDSGNVRAV